MYDIVVTWHGSGDEVLCAVMYQGEHEPSEEKVRELSERVPVSFETVVVSLTRPNSFELVQLSVYEVYQYGTQN